MVFLNMFQEIFVGKKLGCTGPPFTAVLCHCFQSKVICDVHIWCSLIVVKRILVHNIRWEFSCVWYIFLQWIPHVPRVCWMIIY